VKICHVKISLTDFIAVCVLKGNMSKALREGGMRRKNGLLKG